MSEARVRGQPEGATARERIRIWLDREPGVGEHMTWVGKDYSLAQLKADVREALTVHSAGGVSPDAKSALALLLKECEEAGFDSGSGFGWPAALKAARDALGYGEPRPEIEVVLVDKVHRAWPSCPKCGARVESIGNPCPAKCRDEPLREDSGSGHGT